jgi:hypothetical protein
LLPEPGPAGAGRTLTCVHFRPNIQVTSQVGAIGMSQTADACELLLPARKNHQEIRRMLYENGLICTPTRFDCPVARDARWASCPFFEQPQSANAD